MTLAALPTEAVSHDEFRSVITTDELTPTSATVRVNGLLDDTAAFVAKQVALGHLGNGRMSVHMDLSGVTESVPTALAGIRRFRRAVLHDC